MSKQFDIFTPNDFAEMVTQFMKYFHQREKDGEKFQPITIISKRYKKPKTSLQHRAYWAAINQLKKAFIERGYHTNEDEVHEFIKRKSGFTKTIDGVMITKSIADKSEDATNKNLRFLIDFIIEFAATELNYRVNIGDE